jgi:hypothetical protein
LWGYLRQQYGVGYGRLDLVWKHPRRATGDTVSPASMMAHAPVMLLSICCGVLWLAAVSLGRQAAVAGWIGLALAGVLGVERLVAGIRAAVRHRDVAGLFFPPVHLLRDVAWALAIVAWSGRRLLGHRPRPDHSMMRGLPK